MLVAATPAPLATSTLSIGLQIFPFIDDARHDLAATLLGIRKIGYRCVEMLAGLAPGGVMRRALDTAELVSPSLHASANRMFAGVPSVADDLDELIATCRQIGAAHLICSTPWLKTGVASPADLERAMAGMGPDTWRAHAAFLDRTSRKVRAAGLALSYHNHRHDFDSFDAVSGLDLVFRNTSPDVGIELDCGWAMAAGANPVDVIKQLGNRVTMLHLKDLTSRGAKPDWAILGNGMLPVLPILEVARLTGVQAAFVELEPPFVEAPLAMAETSLDYLCAIRGCLTHTH